MSKDTDQIVDETDCPACGAAAGVRCRTVIDGIDVAWTHDARFYEYAGFANARAPINVAHAADLAAWADRVPLVAGAWLEENGPAITAAFERAARITRG